jgi:hypothetical protein
MRGIFIAGLAVLLSSGGACARSESSDSPTRTLVPQVQVIAPASPAESPKGALNDEERKAKIEELFVTDQYQALKLRTRQCLEEAGYVFETDTQFYHKDGTFEDLLEPKQRSLTGRWLQWRLDSERCEDQAGVTALRAEWGVPADVYDPVQIERSNQRGAALMKCMASKGWQIPEPVRLRNGLLIYDVALLQSAPDAQQAWDIDIKVCSLELSGFQG